MNNVDGLFKMTIVSTHSRLKAAGLFAKQAFLISDVSTHSRLKAAGSFDSKILFSANVSTHSRLKAAGTPPFPPAGWKLFQHTAA